MTRPSPVTIPGLQALSRDGQRFVCLTAYDASFARLLDDCGVDVVLVGDSLGMVVQGHGSTLPVSLDEMVYHTACVSRVCRRALVMADMPFLADATPEQALASAARLFKEGGAQIVKIEGGAGIATTVALLSSKGVPVCAHLGLCPQSVHKLGGYRVQGRDDEAASRIIDEAVLMVEAGADMLLLECVPASLAARVVAAVEVPVIGIGAGPDCQGHVLVLYDMLGLGQGPRPRFVENFLAGKDGLQAAIDAYVAAVRTRTYPAAQHSY